jgi:hypothetical protein
MLRFSILCLFFLSMSAAGQDFDYAAYKPATLAEITADLPAHGSDWFAEGHPRYRTRATFTGRVRPTSEDTKEFIGHWVKAMGHPEAYAGVFMNEIEITQEGASYWMPAQEVLVEPLQVEVAAGAQIDLYLLLMGSQHGRLVFAVSEFDALEDAHAPAETGDK